MKLCSNRHRQICFNPEEGDCPLCEVATASGAPAEKPKPVTGLFVYHDGVHASMLAKLLKDLGGRVPAFLAFRDYVSPATAIDLLRSCRLIDLEALPSTSVLFKTGEFIHITTISKSS